MELSLEAVQTFMQPYGAFFARAEGRDLAARYVWGLLHAGPRTPAGANALGAGASERGLQRLLTSVSWDHEAVLQAYRRQAWPHAGVVCVFEAVFPKRGGHSACVARQFSEENGRLLSCQMGIGLMAADGRRPYALDLYVPRFWDRRRNPECSARRKRAGIPRAVRHRERFQMALAGIAQAAQDGLRPNLVTAGMHYGMHESFRDGLSAMGEAYIVAIPPQLELFVQTPELVEEHAGKRRRGRPRRHQRTMAAAVPPVSAGNLAAGLPASALNLPGGARALQVWPAMGYREGIVRRAEWLLVDGADPAGLYLTNTHPAFRPDILGQMHLAQGRSGQNLDLLQARLGLTRHEGRSWIGWRRHVVLVFLAHAFVQAQG